MVITCKRDLWTIQHSLKGSSVGVVTSQGERAATTRFLFRRIIAREATEPTFLGSPPLF
jgi:hypothetical protein